MAKGSTTWKHYGRGYQAAMLDMNRAFSESPERARKWAEDNLTDPEARAAFAAQPFFD